MERWNHTRYIYTSTTAAKANRPRGRDAKPRASKLSRGDREAAGLPAPKEDGMTERANRWQALHKRSTKARAPARIVFALLLASAALLVAGIQVSGLDMAGDPMDAQWINPSPVGSVSPGSPADTTAVTWGTPQAGSPSGYTFVVNSSLDEIVSGDDFLLGTFTHENWPVTGTTLTSVTLKILVHFANPEIGTVTIEIPFAHDETDNTPSGYDDCPPGVDCPGMDECVDLYDRYGNAYCEYDVDENSWCYGCADRVQISDASVNVNIGDETCTLVVELGSSDTFYTEERKSNSIQLYGHFTCPIADIVVEKSDDPDPVFAGEELTYTIVVTNDGPSNATGVTLTDDLPTGLSGATYEIISGGSGSGTWTGSYTIGNLDVNESITFEITATVDLSQTADLYNEACATATQPDPDDNNNCDDETTTIQEPDCTDYDITYDGSTYDGTNTTFTYTVTSSMW